MMNACHQIFDDDNDDCNGDGNMKHLTKIKSILIFICVYFDAAVSNVLTRWCWKAAKNKHCCFFLGGSPVKLLRLLISNIS